MSEKEHQQSQELTNSHEDNNLKIDPIVESNSQSRLHPIKSTDHPLQDEQFLSCPQKSVNTGYPQYTSNKSQTMREATMSLYNSLNASDHI